MFTDKVVFAVRENVKEKIEELNATHRAYQKKYAKLDQANKGDWAEISKIMRKIVNVERTLNVLNISLTKNDVGTYLIKCAYSNLEAENGNTSEEILYCIKDACL
jgi:hypothetical protein